MTSPRRPEPPRRETARAFLDEVRSRVDAWLDRSLPAAVGPWAPLAEAMRYSVMAGGKRLRPALVLATCRAVGGDDEVALPFAGAVELVHTYSLIHDDLPAMDDDDLRRGRPTSHKVFGEALAILAGDALHSTAFEVLLAQPDSVGDACRVAGELAHAAGPRGMVGGQVEDVLPTDRPLDEETLRRVQGGKTAALFRASCRGGAILGGGTDDAVEAAGRYATHLGFAFQMVDDVLDVTGTAESLGKTPGKDAAENRMTWVALEGVEGARARAEEEVGHALDAVQGLPDPELLTSLALYVTQRDR